MPCAIAFNLASALSFLLIVSSALLVGALGLQHLGDLHPCNLCLQQRYWLAGTAGFALVGLGILYLNKRKYAAGFLAGAGVSSLGSSATALFHVGVEQKWWEGTGGCQGIPLDLTLTLEKLSEDIFSRPLARCDQVPWDFLGLSMAGWNAIFSGILFLVALACLGKIWGRIWGRIWGNIWTRLFASKK